LNLHAQVVKTHIIRQRATMALYTARKTFYHPLHNLVCKWTSALDYYYYNYMVNKAGFINAVFYFVAIFCVPHQWVGVFVACYVRQHNFMGR
jgi:hypothetical protein